MKIGVLRTRSGSEVWVSDLTAEFYTEHIRNLGHQVVDIYISENIAQDIKANQVDLIFNATLGQYGEDGRINAILDLLKIPYTHSDYISSGITFDKLLTKTFLNSCNIKNAHFISANRGELLNGKWKNKIKDHPYLKNKTDFFIKPLRDGSTVDSWKININTDFSKFNFISLCEDYLIEELLHGKEMCVGILNNKQIGILEIRYDAEFFTFEAKYTKGKSSHHLPLMDENLKNKILDTCEKFHNFIGLNCLSRFDLLVQSDDFYVLEVNANPAMTPVSLVPDLMRFQGMDLSLLTNSLIKSAKFRVS